MKRGSKIVAEKCCNEEELLCVQNIFLYSTQSGDIINSQRQISYAVHKFPYLFL